MRAHAPGRAPGQPEALPNIGTSLANFRDEEGVFDDLHRRSGGVVDNPTTILTLDARRRLTVPANLAPARPGDHFIAEFDAEEDAIVFRRIAKNANWLAVLKACPVDMDDLPARRREYPKTRKL